MDHQDVNPLQQVPLRYAGYANEVGEAFRGVIPLWAVRASYGVVSVYAAADAFRSYKLASTRRSTAQPGELVVPPIRAAVETGVWQLLVPRARQQRLVALFAP